ncbi:MAG: ABC transporter ATP-binding protein, partial [Gammaproteobacteria bacterium]
MALLEVRALTKHFPIRGGVFLRRIGEVHAVDDVSLSVDRGETLGLVGESGCGKSTVGKTLLKLIPASAGQVQFDGRDVLSLRAR